MLVGCTRLLRCTVVKRRFAAFFALLALTLFSGRFAMALPQFSRMYKVPCSTCHTVAPNLNSFGYAFQANHFNWAGTVAATGKKESPLYKLPISLIATAVAERDYIEKASNALFEAVEIYGANGFRVPTKAEAAARNGGYFVNAFGIVGRQAGGIHAGDLEDAYASLPVYGQRGELAVTFGQTTPMMYQYDPVNSLTDSLPIALGNGEVGDPLSFTEAVPTVRLDYFNNRAKGGPDGNYLSLGLPFGGRFTLNRYASLRKSRGVYLHGFHRYQGYNTVGAFGHVDGRNNVGGLMATYAPLPGKIVLLGVGSIGKGEESPTARQLSIEANYTPLTYLALSGRVDALDAEERHGEIITVETLTFAPFQYQTLRITIEATQGKALRGIAALARIQL